MKTKYISILLSIAVLITCGCSDKELSTHLDNSGGYPVSLTATICQINDSRADATGFADGDKIGVYMVDFSNGTPSSLNSERNHADNSVFTYNEAAARWDCNEMLYFTDASTPADFYGYYPYISEITDVNAIPFSVRVNQSTEESSTGLSGYESSDLLWTKVAGVQPTVSVVNMRFSHILAGVEVSIIEGDGFDDGEWNSLEKSVMVDGTVRTGLFDLSTGTVVAEGECDGRAILSCPVDKGFRAVVLPQNVSAGRNLAIINIGADSYRFQKDEAMEYRSGKLHKFTFKVSKKVNEGTYSYELVSEAVTAWECDPLSHDGLSRAYQVVEVRKGQSLKNALEELGINPNEVINLKLKGGMSREDFLYIRDNMNKIQALNLKEIKIFADSWLGEEDCIPRFALTNTVTLRTIVLPDHLKKIGEYAFGGTIIEGSLKIPEGVTYIGERAFTNYWDPSYGYSEIPKGYKLLANNNLTGVLELPSTLEYIGSEAFRNCDFTGRLVLPSSLKYLGRNVFKGCRNLYGDIHFPESLTEIETDGVYNEDGVFYGMTSINRVIELPKNLKVVTGFGGMDVTGILIPEGAREIGPYAFNRSKVEEGMVIPDNVVTIGNCAFSYCMVPYVILPSGLTRINERTFEGCSNLSDTVIIPKNVEVIEVEAFRGCDKIQALVLPSKLSYVGERAFQNCYSLEYIHCDAKDPPTLAESAFWGIAKDNFTVEVPEESVDSYRNAPGWREFKRIAAYKNFVARPSKYNVLNKGGKKEIVLNADEAWELTECPSWCHVDKISGEKKTVITLTVDEMAKGSATRNGKVEFRLKGDKEYSTHINVGQYDYEYDEDSYVELQKATKGQGIDLFLVGDGYDALDISTGLLMKDMTQTMEYFFGLEPYITYRDYFNVYTAIAMSEDSGVEDINKWRNTKFHTVMPKVCGSTARITADWKGAFDYCDEICTPITSKPEIKVGIILLANHEGYDGVTYCVGESFCSVLTRSNKNYPFDARGLVQHEAGGHGIGWLADEYIYHGNNIHNCPCSCCEHVGELLAEQASGFGFNLSLDGKYKQVPWSHLIFNPSYGDIVDVYEGGFFHGRGVYRSEYNSCMNNNVPYFSTWSRQLIVQRIMKLAGEQFSLEQFYANDKRDMGRDFTTSRTVTMDTYTPMHGNPPVFVKDYKFGKKGGRR